MGLSASEKNRRKRERKKKEKEERRKKEEAQKAEAEKDAAKKEENADVEIDYIVQPVVAEQQVADGVPAPEGEQNMEMVLRRFQERAAVVVTDDDTKQAEAGKSKENEKDADDDDSSVDSDEEREKVSKRKLREMIRPSVAELKRRVQRPDLVEAHDVTAFDPDFLIQLKAVPGSVPVPRHWGRKRKYLQGKRGFEKKPFQLPDFIIKTGIAEVRDSLMEDDQTAKQKNRNRVAPKMGAIDIDYRTLHDAFFKHQSKPNNLTKAGDLYYEHKEMETQTNIKPGGPFSDALKEAIGMTSDTTPPPWLQNLQRYGPPPSYPGLKIPGLNAPLPNDQCVYGYHPGGWGKPPVDPYGRPLYGGNPFDPPGSSSKSDTDAKLVTSHGKTLGKTNWGALPEAGYGQDESSEEESSDDEMEESESEEEEGEEKEEGTESVLPPPEGIAGSSAPLDLRKQPGDETPFSVAGGAPKQLYQVLPQAQARGHDQKGAVFTSNTAYTLPSQSGEVPDGAASVLSKAVPAENSKKKKKKDDDDEDLGKNFKF